MCFLYGGAWTRANSPSGHSGNLGIFPGPKSLGPVNIIIIGVYKKSLFSLWGF